VSLCFLQIYEDCSTHDPKAMFCLHGSSITLLELPKNGGNTAMSLQGKCTKQMMLLGFNSIIAACPKSNTCVLS
jgi:hypothetical protein